MKRRLAPWAMVTTLLLTGCGGGDGKDAARPAAGRSVELAVRWPDRGGGAATRLIPRAAESVAVEVRRDGATVARAYVNRPPHGGETRVTLGRLPVGTLTATATAHPEAGGRGTAQARGTAQVRAEAGRPARLVVDMGSTVARVEIEAERTRVFLGDTLQLTATAYDAGGDVVLVGDTWEWGASGTHADVDGGGRVTGKTVGEESVTVRETESGVSRTVAVRVKGVDQIHVTPPSVALLEDDFADVTAAAYDDEGNAVPFAAAWQWGIGPSSAASFSGGDGERITVRGLRPGDSEIEVRTGAGGYARVPVRVFPARVSGALAASRSGYDGGGGDGVTLNVVAEDISASLGGDGSESVTLSDFPVDDYRLVLVELSALPASFGEDDEVEFTLRLDGPTAPNGQPYFVWAENRGAEVSGTLTRSETAQVFRLIVRDPISGEARHRRRGRPGPPRPVPGRTLTSRTSP